MLKIRLIGAIGLSVTILACSPVLAGRRTVPDDVPRFGPSQLLMQDSESARISGLNSRSPGRAFLYSFLLPGSGELYTGSKKMAGVFFGTEVFLWATFISFRVYGNWKEDDYRSFSVAHAGVDLTGKDYDYFIAVENYRNLREYNEAKLQQRDVNALYPDDEAHRWEWDSDENRERFESLRVASDNAFRRSLFVIGGIVINHVISGIDAVRLARKGRNVQNQALHWGVSGMPEGGVMVCLIKCF